MRGIRRLLVCTAASAALLGCSLDRSPMRAVAFQGPGPGQAGWEQLYETGKEQLAAGYYGLALQKFRAALDRNPASVDLLNAVGATYDRLGRYDIAKLYYERALAIAPGSIETLNNIGYSFVLRGRYADAVPYFDRVLAMGGNPHYRAIAAANRDLAVGRLVERQLVAEPVAVARAPLPAATSVATPCVAGQGATIAVVGERVHRLITNPSAAEAASYSCSGVPVSRVAYLRSLPQAAPVVPVEGVVHAEPAPPPAAPREVVSAPAPAPVQRLAETAPVDVADASGDFAFAHLARAAERDAPTASDTPVQAAPRWIEVSNGAGRNRLAARFRGHLQANGLRVSYLTNDVTFGNARSVVFYKPGFRDAAERYAAVLPVRVELRQNESMYAEIRILLGADVLAFDAATLLAGNKGKPNA